MYSGFIFEESQALGILDGTARYGTEVNDVVERVEVGDRRLPFSYR